MKPASRCDVLIVGAGLAGLSVAWHLKDSGLSVRFVEAADEVGGVSATTEDGGFRFDKTGHLLHLRDPAIKAWIVDGLFGGKIPVIDRKSAVWSSGVYTRYPFQANTYGLPEKVAKECIDGYLEVLEHPPKKPVRTAEDFMAKHFGKGFMKHFMLPYNRKIWGVHPRELSAAWGERFVPIPKKDEVLAGSVKGPDLKLGYNSSFRYPPLGIGELPNRMHAALAPYQTVEFGVALKTVDLKKKVATLSTGERVAYGHLVNTMPLKDFAKLAKGAPASLARNAKLLRSKPVYYLDVALNVPARRPYHWCYVPSPSVPFYRVGLYSNLSAKLAPKGTSSMYVELSDRKHDPKKMPAILAELKRMGLIKDKSDIRFVRKRVIPCAYVIYDKNHAKAVPAIHAALAKHGVLSIGRWGAWNYSSMEDALLMGRDASRTVSGRA